MPRARSPNRDKAKKLWLETGKTRLLKDIAAELGEPENRIRKWKAEDKWEAETLPNGKGAKRSVSKRSAPFEKPPKKPIGAPEGNQNAAGNPGGGAPVGNKNSEKHGIYSSVFWDVLDEQEAQLIGDLPTDEEVHLIDEIGLLTIRERRLMQKIQELGGTPRGMIVGEVYRSETRREFDGSTEEKELAKALYDERQNDKIERNEILPGRDVRISTSSINNSDLLLRAHAELTRVQSQKTRCIETLNKIRQSKEEAKGNSMANDWIAALTGGDDDEQTTEMD